LGQRLSHGSLGEYADGAVGSYSVLTQSLSLGGRGPEDQSLQAFDIYDRDH
jgi:hypothetical protein